MSYEPETVSCGTCGEQTTYTGTRRCNNCYEVEGRLDRYLRAPAARELVREKLAAHGNPCKVDGCGCADYVADGDDPPGIPRCRRTAGPGGRYTCLHREEDHGLPPAERARISGTVLAPGPAPDGEEISKEELARAATEFRVTSVSLVDAPCLRCHVEAGGGYTGPAPTRHSPDCVHSVPSFTPPAGVAGPDEVVPRFAVLPLNFDGAVGVSLEAGAPADLHRHLVRVASAALKMEEVPVVLSKESMDVIFGAVARELSDLVAVGRLRRHGITGGWMLLPK